MRRGRLTYSFAPLERAGFLGAVRGPQALLLGLGAAAAVAILDVSPSATGLFVALLAAGLSLAAAVVPIGGLPIADWIPVVVGHGRARLRGGLRSPAATDGAVVSGSDGWAPQTLETGQRRAVRPHSLRSVELLDARYRDRSIGVLADERGRLMTAVLACRSSSYAMLDADGQERRLAHWGQILAGAASGPVRRIGWIERTAPAQGDELVRHLHGERDPTVPLRGTALIDSYLELIESTARVTNEHEVLLAVQVDRRRAGADPTATLIAESERIARALEGAEVNVLGALSRGQLSRALRTAFDPYARPELAALDTADPGREPAGDAAPWPMADREHWDRYVADGAEHATWWIAGWPRVPVSPMFMETVLARSAAVRTFAVTFEPVPPARSTREVEAQITRDRADGELRRRFGQSETARQRQAREANARREAELAHGHGEVLMAGFVTVSGRDSTELGGACADVVEQAARARLELRRMYGRQAEAFCFTLPLCRGLR